MNVYKYFSFFLLLLFCVSTSIVAQSRGGRKKEHHNQIGGKRNSFKHKKSSGHADSFAKGGNKKGFFARVFNRKKTNGPWVYRKTNPGLKQNAEQLRLFSRNRTNSKKYSDGVLANQNKKRAASRNRGSASFGKRKH